MRVNAAAPVVMGMVGAVGGNCVCYEMAVLHKECGGREGRVW